MRLVEKKKQNQKSNKSPNQWKHNLIDSHILNQFKQIFFWDFDGSFDLVKDFRKGSWIESCHYTNKKKQNKGTILHLLVKENSGIMIVQLMIKVKNKCYMNNLSKQFQEAKYFKTLLHQNFPFLPNKTEIVFWMFSCTEHIKVS